MERQARIIIDLSSSEPAFRQVASSIRSHLVNGVFQPGEQLPSMRKLALSLGLNFNTVADAYRLLAEEGWVELKQGKGAEVLPRQAPRVSKETQRQMLDRLRGLIAEARSTGVPLDVIRQELLLTLENLK